MYQIAICDDEPVFCDQFSRLCREICAQLQIPAQITVFQDAESLLTAIQTAQETYHLLLLDIFMDGLNGMELCEQIRKLDREVTVIFVTASQDYAIECYRFHAFDYLVKPIDPLRLKKSIAEDYQSRFLKGAITLEADQTLVRVFHQEIFVLETMRRMVAIHLQDRMLCVDGTLSKLLQRLPGDIFIRCHQSFAVNVAHIKELTPQYAICTNGKVAHISRTYRKTLQLAFLNEVTKACR